MEDSLKNLFKGHDLTDEQIQKYTIEVLSIVALNIIGAGETSLSSEKKDTVRGLIEKNDIASALEVIHSGYTPEAWELLVDKETESVLDAYLKEVLSVK